MAYDISGMASYAKSNGQILIADLILGGESFNQQGIAVQDGIKSSDKLVDFSIDGQTYIQETNGDPGALSYSGGSVLLDVTISVKEMAIKERYTTNTLNSKITQMQLRAGSDPSNPLPYSDVLVGLKQKAVGKLNDTMLWQGDTSTGNTNANTKHFDGWLTLIKAGAPVTGGTAAALSAATAISVVEGINKMAIENFPAWVDGAYMFMSPKNFSTYYRAVFGLASVIDNQTLEASVKQPKKFYIPGTATLVQSCQGLEGVDNIVVTRDGNLVAGTDLVSEDDSLNLEYLNEALIWRLLGVYKLGAQVARPSEVVITL